MTLVLLIIGIFCGIAICIGTLYSLAQAVLETGRTRAIHIFAIASMGSVMWFLLERDAVTAQLLSPVLLIALAMTFWIEKRWFKILPLLQSVFAVFVFMGYAQFNG
ncbi:MAG: hypothetical protein AAGC79_06010 [Pseudomonadota bacterium]